MSRFHVEAFESRQFLSATPFGNDGLATLQFQTAGGSDTALAKQVLTDASGHIYVVATTKKTIQVARLTDGGVLDTTWGDVGSISLPRTGEAGIGSKAVLDTENRLTVLTKNQVFRFTPAGQTDTNYATNGVLALSDFSVATDLTVDTHDHLYVTGFVRIDSKNVGNRARLERFLARGKIDRTFQNRGVFDTPFTRPAAGKRFATSAGNFVRGTPDGAVVLAGSIGYRPVAGAPSNAVSSDVGEQVTRFDADGALDTAFTPTGSRTVFQTQRDEFSTYALSVAGIRGNGTVSLFERIDSTLSGDDASFNDELPTATPQVGGGETLYRPSTGPFNGVSLVTFTPLPDGRELAALDDQVSVLLADGGQDTSFNGAATLKPRQRRTTGQGVAAAAQADGRIVIGAAGPGRGGVTVRLYEANGEQALGTTSIPSTLSARTLRDPAGSLKFNVLLRAFAGIDETTVTSKAVRVIDRDGDFVQPRLIETKVLADGNVLATFKTTAVDGSSWSAGDSGTYDVRLLANLVRDRNGVTLSKETLGTLDVAIG